MEVVKSSQPTYLVIATRKKATAITVVIDFFDIPEEIFLIILNLLTIWEKIQFMSAWKYINTLPYLRKHMGSVKNMFLRMMSHQGYKEAIHTVIGKDINSDFRKIVVKRDRRREVAVKRAIKTKKESIKEAKRQQALRAAQQQAQLEIQRQEEQERAEHDRDYPPLRRWEH